MNEYVCKDCGGPIHWSRANALWYHDSANDTFTCPGLGMVEPNFGREEV